MAEIQHVEHCHSMFLFLSTVRSPARKRHLLNKFMYTFNVLRNVFEVIFLALIVYMYAYIPIFPHPQLHAWCLETLKMNASFMPTLFANNEYSMLIWTFLPFVSFFSACLCTKSGIYSLGKLFIIIS